MELSPLLNGASRSPPLPLTFQIRTLPWRTNNSYEMRESTTVRLPARPLAMRTAILLPIMNIRDHVEIGIWNYILLVAQIGTAGDDHCPQFGHHYAKSTPASFASILTPVKYHIRHVLLLCRKTCNYMEFCIVFPRKKGTSRTMDCAPGSFPGETTVPMLILEKLAFHFP